MSFALRVLALVYFWQFAAMGALLPFLPPYLENRGFSHSDIGWLLACMTALRVVAPTIWGYIADRTGARVRVVQI
ncbi:MAG: MFS transporter, partial [Gammaproteobacteria bacterium]